MLKTGCAVAKVVQDPPRETKPLPSCDFVCVCVCVCVATCPREHLEKHPSHLVKAHVEGEFHQHVPNGRLCIVLQVHKTSTLHVLNAHVRR